MSSQNPPTPPLATPDDLEAFYGLGGALKLWDDKEAWRIRVEEEGSFYYDLLRRLGVTSVIDLAAASGFHPIHLSLAGFQVTAVDGFEPFVTAGIANQKAYNCYFPFLAMSWNKLATLKDSSRRYDAALCLGASLHHTDQAGVIQLLRDTKTLLRPQGLFIIEQRNYEKLFSERPSHAQHPCGWRYGLVYREPRTLYFHLQDEARGININFQGNVTFQTELIALAEQEGYQLIETHYNHGRLRDASEAGWIEYVFRALV